ncbi:Fasciclin-like arabinogalactan protein 19 [Linum grandiflorum]
MKKKQFLDIPIIFILIIAATATIPTPATSIPTDSLDYVLYFLRSRGHSLFANAIATSDLLFEVLALPSVTILPPSDPAIFAMDMTELPSFYLAVLRIHVIPFRIDLRYLQNNASLHTLVPSRRLHAARGRGPDDLRLDGVQVLFPSLYDSNNVAVFALHGMLPSRVPRHRNPTVFPRVPISSGTNLSSPEVAGNGSSALLSPPTLSAPDNVSVLEFPHNRTFHNHHHHHRRHGHGHGHPPINYGSPALPPNDHNSTISMVSPSTKAAAVSSSPEISGYQQQHSPAFPPIAMAEMTLPPVVGNDQKHTFEPIIAPSPQHLYTPILTPAVSPPVDLTDPAPEDSDFDDTDQLPPTGADGWSGRNAEKATSSGDDYAAGGSGGDVPEYASRKAEQGYVDNREDYSLMDPSEM